MRFSTRAFAFCFIPFAILLGISFWALQSMVQKSVRDELRSAMRDKQAAIAKIRAKHESQVSRFVRFATENAALKAGMQLLNSEPSNPDARSTVEDQLRDLVNRIGFDILAVANSNGAPAAWMVSGESGSTAPQNAFAPSGQGVLEYAGQTYRLVSVPIDQGDENLGYLSVGDRFDFAEFGVPVVLFKNGRLVRMSSAEAPLQQIGRSMKACAGLPECDLRLNGAAYLSIRIQDAALGDGYILRSLQNVDSAAAPVQVVLRKVFLLASFGACLAALVFSAAASQSMVKPLDRVVSHLQRSESAGLLLEFPEAYSRIVEIRDLISSFNRAASSIRDARNRLDDAYVQFVGSLANALDARDTYSAGHSLRVSQLSFSVAQAMEMSSHDREIVRVGAMLHDIGKIGVADHVLQKPGALTDEEFALIKLHPTIGRRILEGVNGLSPYLPCVEFHHENWDGTGYPLGLRGMDVPLAARIVHVADAYDAMTTDRPYRRGLPHDRAISIIRANAGTQFDPQIADVFTRVTHPRPAEDQQSILQLCMAVGEPAVVIEENAENTVLVNTL